jgi:hypothetical protein
MKLNAFVFFLVFFCFFANCVEVVLAQNVKTKRLMTKTSTINDVDFRNFTFPWTENFGKGKPKNPFTLKNGKLILAKEYKLSLESITYQDVADEYYNGQALVIIKIDDGNATYQMLYVYTFVNNKPKLLESFEFGENNIYFGTVFVAHGELVIGRYIQKSHDAECCPSVLEFSYYRWENGKFRLQGKPQIIPNDYVERTKRKQIN